MAVYNKMRPRHFGEVFGQNKAVEILKKSMANNSLPNAMLFVGTRGTGKTTCARIVAKVLNCLSPVNGECCNECESCKAIANGTDLDVIELDAASNNGVDNIRELISSLAYKPVGKHKIVILDEVHMLSMGAFNALLKVLEEPPKYVVFILCTTEAHKVPATIVSRCRTFKFETIPVRLIAEKLRKICSVYGKEYEDGALTAIADAARGSMRDAESIFENFIDYDKITEDLVRSVLGLPSEDLAFMVLDAIRQKEPVVANTAIEEVLEAGGSTDRFIEMLIQTTLDVLQIKMGGDVSSLSERYAEKVTTYAFDMESDVLFKALSAFEEAFASKSRFALVSKIATLCIEEDKLSMLQERVQALEEELSILKRGGVVVSEEVPSVEMPLEEVSEEIPEELPEETDGFTIISDEDLDALAAMGFTVMDESPEGAPVAEETQESDEEPKSEPAESGVSFFEDFARLFG